MIENKAELYIFMENFSTVRSFLASKTSISQSNR